MPKLRDRDVQRNQQKIEDAALRLFITRGFHGVSVRDMAEEAGVSIGNIYNYYNNKEQLFSSLVRRYEMRMAVLMRRRLVPLLGRLDPDSLGRLAKAVREIVYNNPDYWRLMYIDVTEFGNRHFAHSFRHLSKTLMGLGGKPAKNGSRVRRGVDPDLAFTSIYLQFFTYYLVEKLFGGKQHLGMSDDRAVAQLIRIFTQGVGADGNHRSRLNSGEEAYDPQNPHRPGMPCIPPRQHAIPDGPDSHNRPDLRRRR